MHGPACTFWAELTPLSLSVAAAVAAVAAAERPLLWAGAGAAGCSAALQAPGHGR
jgi:hypothetical protein